MGKVKAGLGRRLGHRMLRFGPSALPSDWASASGHRRPSRRQTGHSGGLLLARGPVFAARCACGSRLVRGRGKWCHGAGMVPGRRGQAARARGSALPPGPAPRALVVRPTVFIGDFHLICSEAQGGGRGQAVAVCVGLASASRPQSGENAPCRAVPCVSARPAGRRGHGQPLPGIASIALSK